MSAITRTIADVAARVAFRAAEVTAVTDVGDRFRMIELTGDALAGVGWRVGDKVQIRTDPGGIAARTYTPMSWDAERGSTRLLTHLHGDGPGSRWAASVVVGDRCRLFGPRRSLALHEVTAPLVLAGDETSFALAAAWGHHGAAPALAAVFEVSDPDEASGVLDAVGVNPTRLVVRQADGGQRARMAELVVDAASAHPDTVLCLTGSAQTIAVLRRALKATAATAGRTSLVKAYWDENRTGLD